MIRGKLLMMFGAACLAAGILAVPQAAVAQEAITVVDDGEPVGAQSGTWVDRGGYVEIGGRGEGRAGLYAADEIGTGDFHVRSRIRMPNRSESGAAFRMGASYFGFDGPNRTFFLQGALAGEKHLPLGRSGRLLPENRWATFEVIREGPEIRFVVDGEEVHSVRSFAPAGRVGFTFAPLGRTPASTPSTLQVSDFSVSRQRAGVEGVKPRGYSIPLVDLAREEDRQVVVDREPGQYLGHPTTVLLEDGQTIIAVYPEGHGEGGIVMKQSTDGGKTWSGRLDVPENWATSKEVPTIYPVTGPDGTDRLIMCSGLYPIRMAVSEDRGQTWTPLKPIGDFGGIVAMADLVPLTTGPGHYMAFFHDDGRFIDGDGQAGQFYVYSTRSTDGGLTWSEPEVVATHPRADLCEPGVVRSPDGDQLAMLLRENSRRFNSMLTVSNDEGETWSPPVELPGALTGDRHQAVYAPDGRLFISFRDTGHDTQTQGDWVGWVGTYADIVQGREGQYRVRLMDNKHAWDAAYPALEVLPNGTILATTYGHWTKGAEPYIMSVRFTLDELDARLEGR